MRLFLFLVATFLVATSALCQTAMAQTQDCKAITDPAARLACYDRGAPPIASSDAVRPIRAVPPSKVDGTGYVDSIGAEDALMNERMKGICRGC